MATNDPALAVASWTAAATRCTWANKAARVASSRSRRVSTWARGTTSVWPGNRGRWSRKAMTSSVSSTTSAGVSPAAMEQKRHPPATAGQPASLGDT